MMRASTPYIACDTEMSISLGLEGGLKGRINQICWDQVRQSQVMFASNDGLFSYHNLKGERFHYRKIDIGEVYDRTLQVYQAARMPKIKIKAICIDNFRQELLLADNKGQLMIYTLIDIKLIKVYQLTQGLGVMSMQFSPAYGLLGVMFRNGLSLLLDRDYNMKPLVVLEDEQKDRNVAIPYGIILFQNEYEVAKWTDPKYNIPKQDKNFNTISVMNQSSLRLHQIVSSSATTSALAVSIFSITGSIKGFDLHPSKDYLFILSDEGFVAIFRIPTKQLKFKIGVPPNSSLLSIDPSGLYFAVGCAPLIREQYENKNGQMYQRRERPIITKVDRKNHPYDVRFYESGTGQQCDYIRSVFPLTTFQFSSDGLHFVCGGKGGKVAVWSLSEEMQEGTKDILSQMKVNPFFWKDYPIEIEDSDYDPKKDNFPTLDLSLIKPVETFNSVPQTVVKQKQIVEPKISIEELQKNFRRLPQQTIPIAIDDVKDPLKTQSTHSLHSIKQIITERIDRPEDKQDAIKIDDMNQIVEDPLKMSLKKSELINPEGEEPEN